uniref:Uncharacterized protein n=1 Tax=Anopheles culicifacies TaxID=139723 RepID=A0A182M1E6_9DIPT
MPYGVRTRCPERAGTVLAVFRWFVSFVKKVQKSMYSILQQKSGDTVCLPKLHLAPVKFGTTATETRKLTVTYRSPRRSVVFSRAQLLVKQGKAYINLEKIAQSRPLQSE